MKRVVLYAVEVAVVGLLVGCKGAREVVREVPVYFHDTMLVQRVQKDSIYIHDSVNVYRRGDTVFVSKTVERSVEKTKYDTVYVSVERPVEVVQTEVREVEKGLRWWQKGLQWIGVVGIVVVGGRIWGMRRGGS